MKKTALVLAALVALPGAAFADTAAKAKSAQPSACVATTVKADLDCAPTGSIEKDRPTSHDTATGGKKLGIDVNPWSISNGM